MSSGSSGRGSRDAWRPQLGNVGGWQFLVILAAPSFEAKAQWSKKFKPPALSNPHDCQIYGP